MIRLLLSWVRIAGATLVAIAFVALLGFGIPKPFSVTTDDVPRVSWMPLVKNVDLVLLGIRSRSAAGWTSDGERLYVRASHLLFDSRLHVLDEPGGELELIQRIPRNANPVPAVPGRNYTIFSWDADGAEQFQLYRWDHGRSDPVRLTNGAERAAFGAFEPVGRRFAFTSNRRNGADVDVYVSDALRPGSAKLVFEVTGAWVVADWSPAADELLLIHVVSSAENELHLLDLDSGETRRVAGGEDAAVAHAAAQYTDDGSALYLVSDQGSEFKHLRRLDLATGQETVLTGEVPWDVEGVQESGDGSFLVLSVNEDGRGRTYVYDLATDDMRPLELFDAGTVGVRLHPEEPLLLVNHVDDLGMSRAYTYDLDAERLTLWAGDKPEKNEVEGGRLVRYPTFDEVDGAPREIAAFVYPGVGEGPRPVLIDIHGGPEAQARLTTRHIQRQRAGITVIAPNVRGSTGYGKSFTRLDDGVLREDAVRDIGALLDWIETRPELDHARVAVTGGSYGGYMVLASLVHFGDRIQCGVDVVGVSNFVTFLENTAPYRRDLRRAEYGDERDPEMRAFLESISPLNHAERIVAPLMVVQGANDPRVPVGESRQMVERVRGNQQTVRYIEAADEGHGFRKPWNALYASTARFEMLEECLGV